MNKKHIVGYKEIKFEGQYGPVEGLDLYYTFEDPKVVGVGVEKKFISKRVINQSEKFQIGNTVTFTYNQYGKVERVEQAQ